MRLHVNRILEDHRLFRFSIDSSVEKAVRVHNDPCRVGGWLTLKSKYTGSGQFRIVNPAAGNSFTQILQQPFAKDALGGVFHGTEAASLMFVT